MPLKRFVCVLVLFVQTLGLLPLISRPTAGGQTRRPGRVQAPQTGSTMPRGLQVRLSEGAEQSENAVRITPARATALTERDTQNLLSRLQPIKGETEDEKEFALVERAEKDRWLAFRTVDPLPADPTVTVAIGPGTPSTEGPRKTASEQKYSFRTFGRLRVTGQECGYQKSCSPYDQWTITFSNPLDLEAFDKSQVRVEPEVPGLKIEVNGESLELDGIKKGRTTYRVILHPGIRDEFGQTLGASAPLIFNVKSAPPALESSGDQFVVLDPAGPPRFSVYSINHDSLKVRLYSVGPEHWARYLSYTSEQRGAPSTPPGRLIRSDTIPVKAQPDEMVETRIDLSPAFKGGFGQTVLVVEPAAPPRNKEENESVVAWVQSTQIGLDAFVDQSELIGWATSLKDGSALDGVQMEITRGANLPAEASASTRADGLAHLALAGKPAQGGWGLLVARKGTDVAILPENTDGYYGQGGWTRKDSVESLRWFVFDDRKMYRPGEEVHVKGWIRRIGEGKAGDVGALNGAASSVAYVVTDSRRNGVAKGTSVINALGGFDIAFTLPATMNLGYAAVQFSAQGGTSEGTNREYSHMFQVQEFRRPEFEVTAQANEGPHFVGGKTNAAVTAAYYAGGGLPNAEVNWRVTTTPARFTPPNRGDFTFGKWVPWWRPYYEGAETRSETFAGRTDAGGKHRLRRTVTTRS